MSATKKTKLRALVDMSLRKRPDPKCNEWFTWPAGAVFEPPAHLDVRRAVERGIAEEVRGG